MSAELGMTQSPANPEPKQHHGTQAQIIKERKMRGARGEQHLTNPVENVQPVAKTSPGLATAPSSLDMFKGMWWITSPVSPWEKEKQQDEEALASRLLGPRSE
ncbi:hypothetical protein DUI87_13295 [Hirundo rustica rustica]|uniref:Uncharacterized protein n=1 Tax=Hirundo rustica rustica TaxID=333673 RepID=A0A3M0KHN8_HIRRU|nr:hypothetical protein DUI87_13295 [Hirundo rustica rustica]